MPAVNLSPIFNGWQGFTAGGLPLSGGMLWTYQAGTSTPQATYTTSAGDVANTNPIQLGSDGRPPQEIWLTQGQSYRLTLLDSLSNPVGPPLDNIVGVESAGSANTLAAQLASSANSTLGPGLIGFNQLLAYALATAGRRLRDLGYMVNVPSGGADATAAINAVILAAHQAKAAVLSQDETYSVVVRLEWGQDFAVAGPILLPSGIVLDLNGSRLVGTVAAGVSTAYNNAAPSVIETGYYAAGVITTNRAAAVATQRVVGAGVMNGSIINANCGLNLINFNERSFVQNLEFQNCSATIRTKGSFYSDYARIMVRTSSQAANQYAILLDGAANAMTFKHVFVNGAVRAFQIDATTLQGVTFTECSAEGAYVTNGVGTVDGTGIYINSTAVSCAGLTVQGCYFEGVRKAMQFIAGCGIYGAIFSGNIFNTCEYAVLAGASAVRVGNWFGNSHPDGGGIIRNLVDFSADGNEVETDAQDKSGSSPTGTTLFLTNVLLGNRCTATASSWWDDTASAGHNIALSGGALMHKDSLVSVAREGRMVVTKNLQVPHHSLTAPGAGATLILDSQVVFDESNKIVGHLVVSDNLGGPYLFDFIAIGTVVYYLNANAWPMTTAPAHGKTITITNVGGNNRYTINGLNTALGTVYAIKGDITLAGGG